MVAAVQAFQSVITRRSILLPVHHSTFELSDEPVEEPIERLLLASGKARDFVLMRNPGHILVVPAMPITDASTGEEILGRVRE